jgi:hypothetical protein
MGCPAAVRKAPPVDYTDGTLLVAAMGRQPTTGRSIDVGGVTMRGDVVSAVVTAHHFAGGDMVTFPVIIVHLPHRPAVELVERLQHE